MRSTVRLVLRLTPEANVNEGYKGFYLQAHPSNSEREMVTWLPPYARFKEGQVSRSDSSIGALSVASELLADVSLLPSKEFTSLIKVLFQGGLHNKLLIGAPYSQCLNRFLSREDFNESGRNTNVFLAPPENFSLPENKALPWFDGPGRNYESPLIEIVLSRRYARFRPPISRTLSRLNQSPKWRATVAKMRARGWKDWHLLSSVFHVVMNWRMNQRRFLVLSPEVEMELNRKMMSAEETEDAPQTPLEEFSEERLTTQMMTYQLAV